MYFKEQRGFVVMLVGMLLLTGCVSIQTKDTGGSDKTSDSETVVSKEIPINEPEESKETLTEEQAIAIEEEFFKRMLHLETVGETYEIKNYKSKEELINDIIEIADKKLVTKFVDEFYLEEGGKLYVIPKGGPARILADSAYTFNQVDEKTNEIIQDEEDMLRGSYRLIVKFANIDNKWKMYDRITTLKE